MVRLINNGNYITDTGTCLEWQKATTGMKWHAAMAAKHADGWRMPTKYELFALHEEAAKSRRLIQETGLFWSSSECTFNSSWIVDFLDGSVYYSHRDTSHAVRLVRASKSLGVRHGPSAPTVPAQLAAPLTLRQHFAIAAMASGNLQGNPADLAKLAWVIADALLATEHKRGYSDEIPF